MKTPITDTIIEQVFGDIIGSNTLKQNINMAIDEAVNKSVKTYLRMILDDELENFGNEIVAEFNITETDPAIVKLYIQNKLTKMIASKVRPEIETANLVFSKLDECYVANSGKPKFEVLLG